MTGNIVIVT